MLKIKSVEPDGIGAALEFVPGDIIISFNGCQARDLIDYYFHMAGEDVSVRLKTADGLVEFEIDKDYEEDLGLQFEISARQCGNKCVFCFIDQQPQGMRKTLYIKDDDYRLSFLHGNYITLTNLNTRDFQRIIDEGISPLYISIHATDPIARARLLGRKGQFDVMSILNKLKSGGIDFHGQIVLCPDYNDGPILARSLEDLAALEQSLLSLAVVPVGLTRHRDNLAPVQPVNPEVAQETIRLIDGYQTRFLKLYGRRVVFAADEFYIRAELPVPAKDYYEDYAQLENGIGLIRQMLDQSRELETQKPQPTAEIKVLLITGQAAESTLTVVSKGVEILFPGLSIVVTAVENRFLGEQITVAGLLAGADILETAARTRADWDIMMVPGVSVRAGCFIDDYTIDQLAKALDKPVYAPEDLTDLVNIFRNEVL